MSEQKGFLANPERIRLIHMVRYTDKKNTVDMKSWKHPEPLEDRIELSFYALGYFDRLTYLRATNRTTFTYLNCFSIHYPYKKIPYEMVADQLFCLLDMTQDPYEQDPFEVIDEQRPFLTLILSSIELCTKAEKSFFEILKKMREELSSYLKTEFHDSITQVYITTNCANFCIAVRSSSISEAYAVKTAVKWYTTTIDSTVVQFHASVIASSLVLPNQLGMGDTISPRVELANRDTTIEFRLTVKKAGDHQKIGKEISQKLQEHNHFGSTFGAGDYTLTLRFSQFCALYPLLFKVNFQEEYYEAIKPADADELVRFLWDLLVDKKIDVSYERASGIPTDAEGVARQDREELNNPIEEYLENQLNVSEVSGKELLKLINKLGQFQHRIPYCEYQLGEQIKLVKDLYYTYSDFWYQRGTVLNGYNLYIQLYALLNGAKYYQAIIEKYSTKGYAVSRDQRKTVQRLCEELIDLFRNGIVCINNYSKLLQSMNQYVVNAPNYEIQTKVNTEQYLLAYTAYLQRICNLFYNQTSDGKPRAKSQREKILPLFAIDLNSDKIIVKTMFSPIDSLLFPKDKEKENDAGTELDFLNETDAPAIVAVLCPNYERFANTFHVLPSITHEISHNFRYINREKRNEQVIEYAMGAVAKTIVKHMLRLANPQETTTNCGAVSSWIHEVVKKKLICNFTHNYGDRLDKYRMHNLNDVLSAYFEENFYQYEALHYYKGGKSDWNILKGATQKLFLIGANDLLAKEDIKDKGGKVVKDSNPNFNDQVDIFLNIVVAVFSEAPNSLAAQEYLNLLEPVCREALEQDSLSKRDDGVPVIEWPELPDSTYLPMHLTLGFLQDISSKKFNPRYGHYIALLLYHRCWSSLQKRFKEQLERVLKKETKHDTIFSDKLNKNCKDLFDVLKDFNMGISIEFEAAVQDFYRAAMEYYKGDEPSRRIVQSFSQEILSINFYLSEINKVESISDFHKSGAGISSVQKSIHDALYTKYRNLVASASGMLNAEGLSLTSPHNFARILPMGIGLQDDAHFSHLFSQAMNAIGPEQLAVIIKDKINNYSEIFADLGMCAAFQFSAFGYFRFTCRMFSKDRQIPEQTEYDFTMDRFLPVIATLLSGGNKNEVIDLGPLKRMVDSFTNNACKAVQDCLDFLKTKAKLSSCKEFERLQEKLEASRISVEPSKDKDTRLMECLDDLKDPYWDNTISTLSLENCRTLRHRFNICKGHLETSLWMNCWLKIMLSGHSFKISPPALYKHCRDIYYDQIQKEAWVMDCRKNNAVNEIGEYYNKFDKLPFDGGNDKQQQRDHLELQTHFVAEYYSRSQEKYSRIATMGGSESCPIKGWLDILLKEERI